MPYAENVSFFTIIMILASHPHYLTNIPTTQIMLIFLANKDLLWIYFLLQENFLTHPSLSGSHLDLFAAESDANCGTSRSCNIGTTPGVVPMLHRLCWGQVKIGQCILPTCACSLLKMSSSQDWLIVSMQGGHTAADEGQQVTKTGIWREIKGQKRNRKL